MAKQAFLASLGGWVDSSDGVATDRPSRVEQNLWGVNRLQGPGRGELLGHLPGTRAGQAAYGGSRGTPGTGWGGCKQTLLPPLGACRSCHPWRQGQTRTWAEILGKELHFEATQVSSEMWGQIGKQCRTLLLSPSPSLPLADLSRRDSSESGPSVDLPHLVALLSSQDLGHSSSAGRKERETATHMGSDLSHFSSLFAAFAEPITGCEFRLRFDQRSSAQPARVSLGRWLRSPAG